MLADVPMLKLPVTTPGSWCSWSSHCELLCDDDATGGKQRLAPVFVPASAVTGDMAGLGDWAWRRHLIYGTRTTGHWWPLEPEQKLMDQSNLANKAILLSLLSSWMPIGNEPHLGVSQVASDGSPKSCVCWERSRDR